MNIYKPPMTGNGNHTSYNYGDDWGMVYYCFTHITHVCKLLEQSMSFQVRIGVVSHTLMQARRQGPIRLGIYIGISSFGSFRPRAVPSPANHITLWAGDLFLSRLPHRILEDSRNMYNLYNCNFPKFTGLAAIPGFVFAH